MIASMRANVLMQGSCLRRSSLPRHAANSVRAGATGHMVQPAIPSLAEVVDLDSSASILDSPATLPVLAGLGALGAAIAGIRIYTYFQIQYLTVSMMSRYLPEAPERGSDLRFLMIGGNSRDLYYFPNQTALVVVLDPNANEKLLQQAAIQAGVPVDVKNLPFDDLSWRPASSFDGVFVNGTLGKARDPAKLLAELQRVLKPGAPAILLQRIKGGGAQAVAGSGDGMEAAQLDSLLSTGNWDFKQYDVAVPSLDAHAIGLLVRGRAPTPGVSQAKEPEEIDLLGEKLRAAGRGKEGKGSNKGFPKKA